MSEQEVPAWPWLPTAFPESRKPSVSRSQGVISRQHWWIVFPFTGTKTKEGVVQSVTSGKSTAQEGCGNLWWLLDLLGRPSPLPSGRSLWDTADLPDLPTDERGCLPGVMVQGLAFAVDTGQRKYLIGRVGQKKSNTAYLADWDDSQLFRHFTMSGAQPGALRGFTCIRSCLAKTVVFGRVLSGSCRVRDLKVPPRVTPTPRRSSLMDCPEGRWMDPLPGEFHNYCCFLPRGIKSNRK